MVVSIEKAPDFAAGRPRMLFKGRFQSGHSEQVLHFDVTPDGQRFVMVESTAESEPTEIVVVFNWFEELKRLVPTE